MSNGSFDNNSSNVPPVIQDNAGPVIINDRYELRELIGQGAMSRVYKALDRVLDRLVAVKLLREEYSSDQNFAARFLREARAVAKLSSPNIVDIYDYGEFHNTYFIVMTYVDGTNLKSLIRRERVLPAGTAVTIASEVLVGLAAAHSQGIIHRDVKPQNILIRARDGIAKLTDFGVAYALDGVQITTNGVAIGTAFYMAPEQASGGQIGPYTDLYALGVVLFEMLSGRLPFMGDNQMQIMLMQINNPPPTLQSIGVPVSPELDAVVQKALAKDPAHRFQSALEMREALLNIPLHGPGGYDGIETVQTSSNLPPVGVAGFYHPGLSQETAIGPARRGAAWLAPLVLGLLILAGLALLGVLFFFGNGHSTPTPQAVLPVISPEATATNTPALTVTGPTAPALPTATVTAQAPATTEAPLPTATPAPLPTVTPSPVPPTATPQPTATAVPPTATPVPPTATPVPPTPTALPPTTNTIPAYSLAGAYKRDDGTLYGRPEVALYGAGSGYDKGTVNFDVTNLPRGQVIMTITGLDDERSANCNLQVTLNGQVIYNGPSGLPNVPTTDNGEGGTDRFWGTFQVSIPANLFKAGPNSLVLSNTTPWTGALGIPYILINQLQFTANT